MLEGFKERWKFFKKDRLMKAFFGEKSDEKKQRKILSKLINCGIVNANGDLWQLTRGARSESVLNEVHRLILFNNPSESDLFYLITQSGNEFVINRALKKLEKHEMEKVVLSNCLRVLDNEETGWKIFGRLQKMGLDKDELYCVVRLAKANLVADCAFESLLKRLGLPLVETDLNSITLN
jgi:hypothetical protein